MANKSDLKNVGLKATLPRMKILHMLEQEQAHHLSAEEIHRQLAQSGEDVGLATVYRVLAQFETAGLIKRHRFSEDYSIFELDTGDHHNHIVCISCNKVEEFCDELIESRELEIAVKKGYQITDHSLYIYGICPACRESALSASN
ncbi:MAG: ferric iron uptake transcriptional regulator [Gammaproteobacteria bacterium]|nr:ferric iron uptake transcriptional regulator [Gammaproteobacteria bacterium]